MFNHFVVPIEKIYSKKYDLLNNNQISEAQYTYDNVKANISTQVFQIDTVNFYYDTDKEKNDIVISPSNKSYENVYYLGYFYSDPFYAMSGGNNFEVRKYRIHFKPNIFFKIESVSHVNHTYYLLNGVSDGGNGKESDFVETTYETFMSHLDDYHGTPGAEAWHYKQHYAVVRNKDDSYDIYVECWVKNDIRTAGVNDVYLHKYFNVTVNVNGYNYELESLTYSAGSSTDNNNKNVYSNETSMLKGNISINGESIGVTNATLIYNGYKKRKKTIEIEMPLQKLYNKNGILVYDDEKGEIPKMNDRFTCVETNKSSDYTKIENTCFVVLKVEFNYNGVPKLMIKGKEV